MKHLAIAAFAAVIGFGMMIQDAEAKRLGGGRTSGFSRDSSIMKRDAMPAKPATPSQAASPSSANPSAAAQPKPGMSRWLGPLAGLAAGIGLAALLSHLGLGEGMADMMMIMLLVMAGIFVVRWLMRRNQPEPAVQYAGAGRTPARFEPAAFEAATPVAGSAAASAVPADFDSEGFLRQAKLNFVRMQAANDRGDMDDIRQFTSPEMFAEIQLDYQERGRQTQQTDVIELNADLLDVTTEATRHLASVRFHGQLREQTNGPLESFREVWHLAKPADGSRGWAVVGIQQE
jgi:predicted lipid-binding transport protein (Tim44 family)